MIIIHNSSITAIYKNVNNELRIKQINSDKVHELLYELVVFSKLIFGNLIAGCWVCWCPCVEMYKISKALDEKWLRCLACSACNMYAASPCLSSLRTKARFMMGIKVLRLKSLL